MKGTESSTTKEVRAKALPGPAGRDLPKQEVSCEGGWAASLRGGRRSFSTARPKGKGGERGIESVRFTDETGCGGWVK